MSIDADQIAETIKGQIKDHMTDQPYKLTCSGCGSDLGIYEDEIDGDMDLYLKIEPCQTCIDSAVAEATEKE